MSLDRQELLCGDAAAPMLRVSLKRHEFAFAEFVVAVVVVVVVEFVFVFVLANVCIVVLLFELKDSIPERSDGYIMQLMMIIIVSTRRRRKKRDKLQLAQ